MVAEIIFALVVFVMAFNRETSLILVLLYIAFAVLMDRSRLRWGVLHLAAWGLGTFIVRQIVPYEPTRWTLSYIFGRNIAALPASLIMLVGLLGGLWLVLPRAIRRTQDRPLLAMLSVVGLYVPAFLVFGIWNEIRLLLWLLPIILVVVLRYGWAEQQDP